LCSQRIFATEPSDVLGRVFSNGTHSWARPCAELQELLTPDETKSLLASTLNAHFTYLPIIRAIYTALDHFGVATHSGDRVLELDSVRSVSLSSSGRTKLRILEPAAGVGHFLSAISQSFRANSDRVAVEIDSLTARIFSRLYPQTKVLIRSFEETPPPENYFDLVISNVPFGNYAVAYGSVRESALKASIHDYFFVRSLEPLAEQAQSAFRAHRLMP
jgi:hypothetical protein